MPDEGVRIPEIAAPSATAVTHLPTPIAEPLPLFAGAVLGRVGDLDASPPLKRAFASLLPNNEVAPLAMDEVVDRGDLGALVAIVSMRREFVSLAPVQPWWDLFEACETSEALRAWAPWVRGWRSIVEGHPVGPLDEATKAARRDDNAVLVVEYEMLRALDGLSAGDLDGARTHARRASRMARSESVLFSELLASWILARVRRLDGVPHFSRAIAERLAPVLPPGWRPLFEYEWFFAGATIEARSSVGQTLSRLREALGSTSTSVVAAGDASRDLVGDKAPLAAEVAAFLKLSAGLGAGPPLPVTYFYGCVSDEQTYPCALRCGGADGGETCLAFPARGVPHIDGSERQVRVLTGLAVLAEAGAGGLALTDFFRETYGFRYVRERHAGTLKTHLSRMRSRLGDLGDVVRAEEKVTLVPSQEFTVADPRKARSLHDRVLAQLSAPGGATARDVAGRLGRPLRTVQLALQELVEAGACQPRGAGSQTTYEMEDTTFSVPTQSILLRAADS